MTIRTSIFFFLISFSAFSQQDIDTKSIGRKILKGTVKPSDNDSTFRVLDSLFCNNPAEKDFYFKVANKIQNMSDGALGEFFSGIASKYYLDYNMEFIRNSSKLTAVEIEGWLNQACYDIAATEQSIDSLPKIKKRLDNLVTNCSCSDNQKNLIKKYNNFIYSCVDNGIRNP